jgi:hypothetical protein
MDSDTNTIEIVGYHAAADSLRADADLLIGRA